MVNSQPSLPVTEKRFHHLTYKYGLFYLPFYTKKGHLNESFELERAGYSCHVELYFAFCIWCFQEDGV